MSAASTARLPDDMLLHIGSFVTEKDQPNWVCLNRSFIKQFLPELRWKQCFRLIRYRHFQPLYRHNETLEEYTTSEITRFTKTIILIDRFTPALLNQMHTQYLGMGHFLTDTLLAQAVIQAQGAGTVPVQCPENEKKAHAVAWKLYSQLIHTLLNQGAKLESIRTPDLRNTLSEWLKPQPKPVQPPQKSTSASAAKDESANQ